MNEERRRINLIARSERWRARAVELRSDFEKTGGSPLPSYTHGYSCRCGACKVVRQVGYAKSRAESLLRPMGPRLEACGTTPIPIACACESRVAYERCRQWWLCRECSASRAVRQEIRIKDGLRHAYERELETWARSGGRGMKPQLLLLTLTQRHSGDVAADRKALADGWRGLYKSMHKEKRKQTKIWGKFPYVWVYEVTPGRCTSCQGYVDDLPERNVKRSKFSNVMRSGSAETATDPWKADRRCACVAPTPEGHVHMHVAVIWKFRPWDRVRALWKNACPSSEMISILRGRDDGKPTTPGSVSRYLGKYLSKGVDHRSFTEDLRADVSVAMYNAHSVGSSAHFFLPDTHHCRRCATKIKRVIACEPWLYDSLERDGQERYWLVRVTTLYEAAPEIVQHVYGKGTRPDG